MVAALVLSSCSSFNYVEGNISEVAPHEVTLEELLDEYGITENIVSEQKAASEEQSETDVPTDVSDVDPMEGTGPSTQEQFAEEVVDVDDADQWTELAPAPTEEEKSLNDPAVPNAEESVGKTSSENTDPVSENESMFPWQSDTVDMAAIAPVHMEPKTPVFVDSSWGAAEDIKIPEPSVSTTPTDPEEQVSDDMPAYEPEVTRIDPAELPDVAWEVVEEPEKIETGEFIEGIDIASSWDMLSEYDRFVVDSGYEIKEADAVVTSSFVIADPTPITDNGFNPPEDFNMGYEEPTDAPLTLEDTDEEAVWYEVQVEPDEDPYTEDYFDRYEVVENEEPVDTEPVVEDTDTDPDENADEQTEAEEQSGASFLEKVKEIWNKVTEFFKKCWSAIMSVLRNTFSKFFQRQ